VVLGHRWPSVSLDREIFSEYCSINAEHRADGGDVVTALRAIEVRTAAVDDVPKVAAVLADAFIDDPLYTWLLPGSLRLRARLRTMFEAEMEHYVIPTGTVWTTPGYDGAVTELPPGAWEMPMSFTGNEAIKLMRAFGTRLALAGRVQRAMEERHLREPHFYVRTVGVRTALQGQGVGSALMQPTLERADALGLPTYIEASSQRSAALYERLGFVHMDVFELPDGGPPVWLMRRPPTRASQRRLYPMLSSCYPAGALDHTTST
jgi:GNAT superfamily N-acetyltransferase